jgi:hypothetical protein
LRVFTNGYFDKDNLCEQEFAGSIEKYGISGRGELTINLKTIRRMMRSFPYFKKP